MRKQLSGISIVLLVSLSSSGLGADPLPSDKSPKPVAVDQKTLVRSSEVWAKDVVEATPVLYQGRQLLFCSRRPFKAEPGTQADYLYLYVRGSGIGEGEVSTRFGYAHSLGSAFVEGDTLHVYAAEIEKPYGSDWFRNINHFWSTDLKTWKQELAIPRADGEHLLNSSVCRDEQGYLMAYESDKPVGFCFKFARSKDMHHWEKVPGLVFAGVDGKEYSACPVIRYFKPYYYVIYLHAAIPGHNGHVSFLARSKDLATWQLSPQNPILEAEKEEGSNFSDVDLIEIDGKTYVYYCTGNQINWGDLKRAVYPGPMRDFFESYFLEGATMTEVSARR